MEQTNNYWYSVGNNIYREAGKDNPVFIASAINGLFANHIVTAHNKSLVDTTLTKNIEVEPTTFKDACKNIPLSTDPRRQTGRTSAMVRLIVERATSHYNSDSTKTIFVYCRNHNHSKCVIEDIAETIGHSHHLPYEIKNNTIYVYRKWKSNKTTDILTTIVGKSITGYDLFCTLMNGEHNIQKSLNLNNFYNYADFDFTSDEMYGCGNFYNIIESDKISPFSRDSRLFRLCSAFYRLLQLSRELRGQNLSSIDVFADHTLSENYCAVVRTYGAWYEYNKRTGI